MRCYPTIQSYQQVKVAGADECCGILIGDEVPYQFGLLYAERLCAILGTGTAISSTRTPTEQSEGVFVLQDYEITVPTYD